MKRAHGPVLLVDDDPEYRYLLEEALHRCPQCPPLQVLHGGSRLPAWLAANPRPCLILLDIHLPLVNGLEVLRALKASAHYKDIPVVMLTGVADRPSVVKAYMHGARAYIIKPDSLQALQDRLELLSGFWRADESVPTSTGPLIGQEFERLLGQYRRAVFEKLQCWQVAASTPFTHERPDASGDTDPPVSQLVD